jgi:hypothetical protein
LNYSKGDFEKPEKPLGVELDCSKYKNPSGTNTDNKDFDIN